MLTVGVDLSASERNTALAEVEWAEGRARVGEPSLGLADPELLELLTHAEWVGIDAPFGSRFTRMGRGGGISLDTFVTLITWLEVDAAAFLEDLDAPTPPPPPPPPSFSERLDRYR